MEKPANDGFSDSAHVVPVQPETGGKARAGCARVFTVEIVVRMRFHRSFQPGINESHDESQSVNTVLEIYYR